MTLAEQLKQIPSFRNQAGFLSNFSPYSPSEYMVIDDVSYPSNEHYYQAMKFTDKHTQQSIASHPFKGLKSFCRRQKGLKTNWDDIKLEVMRFGLAYKFGLPRFRDLLLLTGNEELVEYNTWNDTYWGICNNVGQNNLGKLLMQIREKLRN